MFNLWAFKRTKQAQAQPSWAEEMAMKLDQMAQTPELALRWVEDGNGYVREAALKHLSTQNAPAALHAIIARLNDWVPQVRLAAESAYDNYVLSGNSAGLLACLDSILGLLTKSRVDHSARLKLTMDFLLGAQARAEVLARFASLSAKSARILLPELFARHDIEACTIANAAMAHTDSIVRKLTLNLLSKADAIGCYVFLERGLYDTASTVRATAFRLHIDRLQDNLARQRFCTSMLFERALGLRTAVIWYAQQAGMDVPAFYRAQLDVVASLTQSQIEVLLWEAAKAGMVEALPLARHAMASKRVRVRICAIKLILKVEPESAPAMLSAALRDTSTKLHTEIGRLLRDTLLISHDVLVAEILFCAKRGAVAPLKLLLAQCSGWDAFALWLRLLAEGCGDEVEAFVLAQLAACNTREFWFGLKQIGLREHAQLALHANNIAVQRKIMGMQHVRAGLQVLGILPAIAHELPIGLSLSGVAGR